MNNKFLKSLYAKLFLINDSPQKIALGVGLGVLAGILPLTGPLAAIFLAFIFRANRAAALIGSLITNTWLTFITFLLSIKVGSVIMGLHWQDVKNDWETLIRNFHPSSLLKVSFFKLILPVAIGYSLIAICIALLAYIITLTVLKLKKHP